MIFTETELAGAFVIDIQELGDDRGFFARSWCDEAFRAHGLSDAIAQCNISFNAKRGTLRGMHYQTAPHSEAKLVRCTRGEIRDVIIDLRQSSATCGRWFATELTADNRRMMYVPAGFAHGFETLADDCEVFYQMSARHAPDATRGVRWNDPAFGIVWRTEHPILSARDVQYPDYA